MLAGGLVASVWRGWRPPKSHAGRRTLPLLGPVAVVLEQQRERQFLDRDVAGLFWVDSGLVLTTSTGNPIEPRNVNRSFARLCREAKLPELSPHDMRHMCATMLKDLGVPARDAMSILGHSRITMTLEIYTASGDEAHRTALDRSAKRSAGRRNVRRRLPASAGEGGRCYINCYMRKRRTPPATRAGGVSAVRSGWS